MTRKKPINFIVSLLFASLAPIMAQLPPVFAGDESRTSPDELAQTYVYPKRVVWQHGVDNAEVLTKMPTRQSELGEVGVLMENTHAGDTASILLDFGRELHGGIHITTAWAPQNEPCRFRIRFGESVAECNSTATALTYEKASPHGYATNDHAMRDFVIPIPRFGQLEQGNSGFRFVRIDMVSPQAKVYVKEVSAVFRYRAIPYVGSFHSSDARLDSIWMTGAYTVHLNMQEYIWDGIKRDRLVWIGDMHPEVKTVAAVFGYNDVIPRSLDFACQEFPLPHWQNDMPAYSMWYLKIQHDWYMQNGDIKFLQKHKPYIMGVIDKIDSTVDARGNFKATCFLDWPSESNRPDVQIGVEALAVWSLKGAEKMCVWLGDEAHAATCRRVVARIERNIKKPAKLKQAAALMALAGLMKPQVAYNKYVGVGGARGYSTFYGYYMLLAEAMAGQHQSALDVIRRFWGGMLDVGATTFWEDFDLDWIRNANRIDELGDPAKPNVHGDFGAYCYPGFRLSLCHGWASGPTAYLSQSVLGVNIVEPGCKRLSIEPHLADLRFAEGTYPTPYGTVSLRHERMPDGTLRSTIKKPRQVEIVTSVKNATITDNN